MNDYERKAVEKIHNDIMESIGKNLSISDKEIDSALKIVSFGMISCLAAIITSFGISFEDADSYLDNLKIDTLNLLKNKPTNIHMTFQKGIKISESSSN